MRAGRGTSRPSRRATRARPRASRGRTRARRRRRASPRRARAAQSLRVSRRRARACRTRRACRRGEGRRPRLAVGVARLPVAGQSRRRCRRRRAGASRVREGEAVVERARLREAQEKDSSRAARRLRATSASIKSQHGAVVQRDGLLGPEVRQPAEAVARAAALLARLLHVLVRALQRGDGEAFGHVLPRLAHHPTLVAPVAVQRDEQRRGLPARRLHVVIESHLRRQRQVGLQRLALLHHSLLISSLRGVLRTLCGVLRS